MKRMMIVFLFVLFGLQFQNINVKAGDEPIQDKIEKIKKAKDKTEKSKYMKEILIKKLQTSEDVEDIAKLSKVLQNRNDKETIMSKLSSINEEDKHLEDEYIKILDDKDKAVRVGAMYGLVKLKSKRALPKIRKKVKDFGKMKYMEYKAMENIDQYKALDVIEEASVAAETLGELKDEESIPLLAEKIDVLGEYATIGLSKIGKKALPTILELAKKEPTEGVRSTPAHSALAGITDKEAKPDLIYILKTNMNKEIRSRVLFALVHHMYDDEVLKAIEDLYTEEKDDFLLTAMRTKKSTPFLINVLKNDKNHNARECAAVKLGDIRDSSSIPALEEALNDEDREVRYCASRALNKITGKEYEWEKKNK